MTSGRAGNPCECRCRCRLQVTRISVHRNSGSAICIGLSPRSAQISSAERTSKSAVLSFRVSLSHPSTVLQRLLPSSLGPLAVALLIRSDKDPNDLRKPKTLSFTGQGLKGRAKKLLRPRKVPGPFCPMRLAKRKAPLCEVTSAGNAERALLRYADPRPVWTQQPCAEDELIRQRGRAVGIVALKASPLAYD